MTHMTLYTQAGGGAVVTSFKQVYVHMGVRGDGGGGMFPLHHTTKDKMGSRKHPDAVKRLTTNGGSSFRG